MLLCYFSITLLGSLFSRNIFQFCKYFVFPHRVLLMLDFFIFRNVDLFLDGWIDNRVRVLIFGKTEIARLRYLTTAFKYRSRAQVGYVKIDDPESIEVVSKYEIPGDSDSLLLFQENTRIPVVRISMQVRISQKL